MWPHNLVVVAMGLLGAIAACRPLDMYNQPKYLPYQPSELFPDGRSARMPPEGAVPRDAPANDNYLAAGRLGGQLIHRIPFAIDLTDIERGRERYDIYCAPCHGNAGYGDGMIVQRGYSRPPSLHEKRLVGAPDGHYVEIIRLGFRLMPPYATAVLPEDRWRITAYIRALQLSQQAHIEALPKVLREKLESEHAGTP